MMHGTAAMAAVFGMILTMLVLVGATSTAHAEEESVEATPPTFTQSTVTQQYGTLVIPDDPDVHYAIMDVNEDEDYTPIEPGEYVFELLTSVEVVAYRSHPHDYGEGISSDWSWYYFVEEGPGAAYDIQVRRAGAGRLAFYNPNWAPVEVGYARERIGYSFRYLTAPPGRTVYLRTKLPQIYYSATTDYNGMFFRLGAGDQQVRNPRGDIRARPSRAVYLMENQLPRRVKYVLRLGGRKRVVWVKPGGRRRVILTVAHPPKYARLFSRGVLLDAESIWDR